MTPGRSWRGVVLVGAALLLGPACQQNRLTGGPRLFESGRSEAPPVRLFEVEWQVRLVQPKPWEYGPRETATPAIDPDTGRIIALTRDGVARAVSPEGNVVWSLQAEAGFSAGARVLDGVAYLPGGDGTLYAVTVRSGEVRWTSKLGEELGAVPVVTDDRVLVASYAGTVFSVSREDGKVQWTYRRDLPSGFTIRGASATRVDGQTAYVGFPDGFVAALDINDGTARWEKGLSEGGTEFLDVDSTPVLDGEGRLIVASYRNGLYALDPASGAQQWHTPVQGLTGLLGRGEVVFSAGDSRVTAWHGETGKEIWSLALDSEEARTPVFADGLLVVPVNAKLLFVDPAAGRTRLSWDPGQGVSAPPLYARARLFVLSNNGYLYSMRMGG